jgi:hypothetical protein
VLRRRCHGGTPGEASERGRRSSTAATARLNGGVAEGAKGPLGGRGALDRSSRTGAAPAPGRISVLIDAFRHRGVDLLSLCVCET